MCTLSRQSIGQNLNKLVTHIEPFERYLKRRRLVQKIQMCAQSQFCPCNSTVGCYNTNKQDTALIFFDTMKKISSPCRTKKIFFISEAPWDFPGTPYRANPNVYYAHSVNEFIDKHLQRYGFVDDAHKLGFGLTPMGAGKMPKNIFQFIWLTFNPIFRLNRSKRWAYDFLNSIYWTHLGRRRQRQNQGKSIFKRCLCLLEAELCAAKPNLVVIASASVLQALYRVGYGKLEKLQAAHFRQYGHMFDISRITSAYQSHYKVAIFPNPSPTRRQRVRKVRFYQQPYIANLIKDIHSHI